VNWGHVQDLCWRRRSSRRLKDSTVRRLFFPNVALSGSGRQQTLPVNSLRIQFQMLMPQRCDSPQTGAGWAFLLPRSASPSRYLCSLSLSQGRTFLSSSR
jgi:hypothetical protein